MRSLQAKLAIGFLVALLLVACGGGRREEATPSPTPSASPAAAVPRTTPPADALRLPEDDRPHERYVEWWYYTGHLEDEAGEEFGFQFVVFQVLPQPDRPVYIAQLALTDVERGFRFDTRTALGHQPRPERGFQFNVGGWWMTGYDGRDQLAAALDEASLDLRLRSTKPPALHGGCGLLEFGPAGWTYYYSRTRMTVEGMLTIAGEERRVAGSAWFDHQWGDFDPVYEKGGWDWVSTQLDDNTELMVVVLRDREGRPVGSFGTYVDARGTATPLEEEDFTVSASGSWRSPGTGVEYPSGWTVSAPGLGLELAYQPLRQDQELDVRRSTGNVYWEGAVRVTGTRRGAPVTGRGYVELTGYENRVTPTVEAEATVG